MSPGLFLDNKKYISAKEASLKTGYSQDYIGQLSRANKIDSKRIGRIWYVAEDSILKYNNVEDLTLAKEESAKVVEKSRATEIRTVANKKTFSALQKSPLFPYVRLIDEVLFTFDSGFYRHILPFALGLVLTLGLVSARNLDFAHISKSISSAPQDTYRSLSDVTDFYAGELGVVYTNLAGEVQSLEENPKTYVAGAVHGALVTVASTPKKVASLFAGSVTSPKSLTASLALNPIDSSGVTVYNGVNSIFDRFIYSPLARLFAPAPETVYVVKNNSSTPSSQTKTSATGTTQASPKTTIINQPVIERVREIVTTTPSGLTQDALTEQLEQLRNKISSDVALQFATLSTGSGGSITNVYNQIAQSQIIDNLYNTNISNPNITGGSISGATVNAATLTSNSSSLGTSSITNLSVTNISTSTFAGGIEMSSGCFSINGACIGGGAGTFSNTLAGGGTATTTFYNGGIVFSDGNKLTQSASPANLFWDETNKKLGVGTSTPFAKLSINPVAGDSVAFVVGSSTATQLSVSSLGFGTTTLSGLNISGFATSTSNVGFNITTGCFAVNGNCVGSSGGAFSNTLANGGTATTTFYNGGIIFSDGYRLTQASSTPSLFWDDTNTRLGLGTSTPFAKLSVNSIAGEAAFVVGSSTKTSLIVDKSGNVGIGTANPTAYLDIRGPAAGTAALLNVQASVNNTSAVVKFTGHNGSVFQMLTNGGVGNIGYIDQTDTRIGNLVVGTNPGTNSWPSGGSLYVTGKSGLGTTTPYYGLTVASTTGPQLALSAGAGLAQWAFANEGGNFYLGTTTVAGNATTSISALSIIGSSGNVGIGTASPGATLEVNSEANSGIVALTRDAGSQRGILEFGRHNSGTTQISGQILSASDVGGVNNGYLAFYTSNSSGASGEAMRILGNNNVGIGTPTPNITGYANSVVLTVKGTSAVNSKGILELSSAQADADALYIGGTVFPFYSNHDYLAAIYGLTSGTTAGNRGGSLVFETKADGGSSVEKMRITNTGLVGIGTTSPYSKLSIGNLSTDAVAPLFTVSSSTSAATSTLFTILNSGNVGIGVTPTHLLDIGSNANVTSLGAATFNGALTGGTQGTTASEHNLSSRSNTSGTNTILALDQPTAWVGGFITATKNSVTKFSVDNTGGAYYAGNVGIGTTTPYYGLTIASTTGPQLALSAGAGLAQWTLANEGGNFYLATTTVAGNATSTPVLSILANGASVFGGTAGTISNNGNAAYLSNGSYWNGTNFTALQSDPTITEISGQTFAIYVHGGVAAGNTFAKGSAAFTVTNSTGVNATVLNTPAVNISDVGVVRWSSSGSFGAVDIGLSRGAAGKLYVGNGTAANSSGTLIAGTIGVGTTTPYFGTTLASTTGPQLALSAGAGLAQWNFANLGGNFYLGTTTLAGNATSSISAIEIDGTTGTTTLRGLNISSLATSTSNVGFKITSGCYAIGTTCIGGSSFSNTLANGGTATTTFYNGGVVFSDGNKLTQSASPANLFWDETNKRLGLGTSTPFAKLSVGAVLGQTAFVVGSSATTSLIVDGNGNVGIGTSTPNNAQLLIAGPGSYDGVSAFGPNLVELRANDSSPFALAFTRADMGINAGVGIWLGNENAGGTLHFDPGVGDGSVNDVFDIDMNGVAVSGTYSQSGNVTAQTIAQINSTTASTNTNQLNGLYNAPSFNPGGASLSAAYGFLSLPNISGSSINIGQLSAGIFRADTGAGYSGTITNLRQIEIDNAVKAGGTITSQVGLYIDNLTSGNSNWGVYDIHTGNNYFAGRIGIATTSPGYALSVEGSGLFDGGTLTASTLLSTSSSYFATSGGSVGIGTTTPFGQLSVNSAAGSPAFVVGSSTRTSFIIDKNGNVGIGTTNPGYTLDVIGASGTRMATAANSYAWILDGGGAHFDFPTGSIRGQFVTAGGGNGQLYLFNSSNVKTINLSTNDNSYITGGNVGVGTTTPQYELSSYSATGSQLALSNGAGIAQWTFANQGGNFYISTTTLAGNATTTTSALSIIGSSGNVGIGTSAPSDVNGSVNLMISKAASATDAFAITDGTRTFAINLNNSGGNIVPVQFGSVSNHNLGFYTNNQNPQMVLTTTGLVGIGTTTPFGQLSVNPDGIGNAPAFIIGSSTQTFVSVASGGFGTTTLSGLTITGSATSTSNVGFSITSGCYAIGTTCIGGSGGGMSIGGSVTSGTTGSVLFVGSGGLAQDNSNFFWKQNASLLGIGTTTPYYGLTVASTTGPQLALSAGAGIAQWAFSNIGGNFYLGTTTVAGNATTSLAAFSIIGSSGNIVVGGSVNSAANMALALNAGASSGDAVGRAVSILASNATRSTSGGSNGGAITLTSGNGTASGLGQAANGGAITITTGNGNASGGGGSFGGLLTLTTGTVPNEGGSTSGAISITTGGNSTVPKSGDITIQTGQADNTTTGGTPGKVLISTGSYPTNGGSAGTGIQIQTSNGGSASNCGCAVNGAAGINITSGTGSLYTGALSAGNTAGAGGVLTLAAGAGGANTHTFTGQTDNGGAGAAASLAGGAGGAASGNNGTGVYTGGAGGALSLFAGSGGSATGNAGTSRNGGNGGNVLIYGGVAGTGATTNGLNGNVVLGFNGTSIIGNVGIATSTPQWALTAFSTTSPQLALSAGGGFGQWTLSNVGGDFFLGTTTVAGTATTTIPALSILSSSGNVGIGTSSPMNLLSLRKDQNTSTLLQIDNLISGTSATAGLALNTAGAGSNGAALFLADASYSVVPNWADSAVLTANSTASGGLVLYAVNDVSLQTSAGTDALTVHAGNTGIATTTPYYGLTIASTTGPQLALSAGAGLAQWAFANEGGNFYLGTTTIAGNATTSVSAFSIASTSGNVGIGTDAPVAKLDVKGNVNVSGTVTSKGGVLLLKSGSGSTSSGNTNLDSYAMASGLGSNDSLHVVVTEDCSSAADCPFLSVRNSTDGVNMCFWTSDSNNSQHVFDCLISQSQASNTTITSFYDNAGSNDAAAWATANFTTAWTGNWTISLATDASGTGGTVRWRWAVYKYSGSLTDLAENYPSDQQMEAGDVASFDSAGNNRIKKALGTSTASVAGIISTTPGITLGIGGGIDIGENGVTFGQKMGNEYPLALKGRVPVKISEENGPVHIGDYLTVSKTLPGYAMKMTESGQSIGTALQDSSGLNKITVFVNLGYQEISDTATATQSWADSFGAASQALRDGLSALGNMVVHAYNGAVYAVAGVFDKVFAKEVHTDKLCVGSVCVTETQFLAMVQGDSSNATSTPSTDTSTPIIILNGDNPAQVSVGSTYSDMGATVTDTNGDGSVNNNLGLHFNVDGTDVNDISIDTSVSTSSPQATTTHTIIYSSVDAAGNMGYATRTVEVIQ